MKNTMVLFVLVVLSNFCNGQSLVRNGGGNVSVATSGTYKGLKEITSDSLGLDLNSLGSPIVVTGTDKFAIYDPEGTANASVRWDSIVSALSSSFFKKNGNSFGAIVSVGTNDAFGLNVETNNVNRIRFNETGRLFSGTLTDALLTTTDSMSFIAGTINNIGTTNNKILFNESTDVISVQPDGVVTAEFNGTTSTVFTSQVVRIDAYASGTAPSLAFREDDANGTNEISLKAPATLGSDYTQTLTAATGEIPVVLRGSGNLNFPSTTGGTCQDLTLVVSGVADGDPVSLGIPVAAITTNGQFTAYVSGANTVNVRFCTAVTEDPAIGVFKVCVNK